MAAPPEAPAVRAPPVSLHAVTVVYGDLVALDSVSFDLSPGTRHAVVGENGAGKSTLMKVLFGLQRPTSGEVRIDGQPRRFRSPADAIALGIGMVQQHFELIAPFTVAENVTLGSEPTRGPLVDRRVAEQAVADLAAASGLPIDPRARVASLSVAAQQRVEILKALYRKSHILILDEPTAVLAPSEADDLWRAADRLAASGHTIVFVTHKLDDVIAHADHVTVLRHGRRVLSAVVPSTTAGALAEAMVGGETFSPPAPSGANVPLDLVAASPRSSSNLGLSTLALQDPPSPPFPAEPEKEAMAGPTRSSGTLAPAAEAAPPEGAGGEKAALSLLNVTVRGDRGERAVDGVTLEVRAGEIVGLAGVDGSGQQELIEAIVGLRPAAGEIALAGRDVGNWPVAARRAAGLGVVPEDRLRRALILSFTVEENAILGEERNFANVGGLLRTAAIRAFFRERAAAFDVRGAEPGTLARSLSGGNQQKLVLAREIARRPGVLIAAQPTRGLDFAATAFVRNAIRAERDRGAGVLLQSLDLDEIRDLSDRVAVMFRGRIVGIVDRADATESRIGRLMTGAATG
jgi:simple sugar transport system ATP-binding protein